MSTERQIQASRDNGSKSRGPVTAKGKRASSGNAITHGMLAAAIVLEDESKDRFCAFLTGLHEEFQPQTPFEESLIQNMAVVRLHQMRIWQIEKAGLEHQMRIHEGMGGIGDDPASLMAFAFRTLSDTSRSLELIHRYQTRYERQYLRAHQRYLEVRDRRTEKPILPNEPGK